jgi:oligopeptide transport system substrate-binding protein
MDDAETPKPRTVTADDFAYGFFRTLDAATASPYVYVLNNVLAGGAEYNAAATADEQAKLKDAVGVKVIDPLTIQLTFKAAAAYNAAIAGMWMGYAQPSWLIAAKGDRWIEPGIIETYGPFALKEWVHDYSATLIKNPFWPGTESMPVPKIKEVVMRFIDTPEALAEFEAGNMDTSGVDTPNLSRVKSDPKLSKELVVAPNLCSYYYGFNTTKAPMDDARVRRAFSMAVDRKSLVENVLKGGQIPSQWLENPGLAGAPTLEKFPDAGIKYDPATAKSLLAAYLTEKGLTADKLDVTLMFNTSAGHQLIAESIQLMWKETLGVNVKLSNQEWKVHLAQMDGPDAMQIFRTGWCLDYPDANNFTKDLIAIGGSSNQSKPGAAGKPYGGIQWLNPAYEDLIAKAAAELDNAKRQDLYAQASKIAMYDDAVVIPIYWYARNTVTKPYITRTFSSGGHEAFEKWDIDMAAKAAYK